MPNSIKLPIQKDITTEDFSQGQITFNKHTLNSVALFYDISFEQEKHLESLNDKFYKLKKEFSNDSLDMDGYLKGCYSLYAFASENKIKIKMNHKGDFVPYVQGQLKIEYQTDKQIAQAVRAGKGLTVKVNVTPERHFLHVVKWEESERGWGTRPDGCSVHWTEEDAKAFVKKQQDSLPAGPAPDEYTRPSGNPSIVEVSRSLFEYIRDKSPKDTWIDVNNPKNLVNFDASTLKKKITP